MTEQDVLILQVGEEAAEITQQVSKYLRFGKDHIWDGQVGTPAERIMGEVLDLLTLVRMCQERRFLPTHSMTELQGIEAKRQRVLAYLELSKQLGRVQ